MNKSVYVTDSVGSCRKSRFTVFRIFVSTPLVEVVVGRSDDQHGMALKSGAALLLLFLSLPNKAFQRTHVDSLCWYIGRFLFLSPHTHLLSLPYPKLENSTVPRYSAHRLTGHGFL